MINRPAFIVNNMIYILFFTILSAQPTYEFEIIAIPEMDTPIRMNDDGSKIVGTNYSGQALLWTDSAGVQILGEGELWGISEDDRIFGEMLNANGYGEAALIENGEISFLGNVEGGNSCDAFYSSGLGISTDGSTGVGMGWISCGTEAFYWTDEDGIVGLGQYEGQSTKAQAVSGDGQLIGGWAQTSNRATCLWDRDGNITLLGSLQAGNDYGEVQAINNDGTQVVGYCSGNAGNNTEGFVWTEEGGMFGLGVPPNSAATNRSLAMDISENNVVIGQYLNETPVFYKACIYTEETGEFVNLRDYLLNLGMEEIEGWDLHRALCVSDDGNTIAGYGKDPSNNWTGWRIRIIVGEDPGEMLLVPSEYATIQDAINASEDGDTVLVAPGTYVENINYSGKNIVIGSYFLTYGMDYFIEQTIIDGNQDGSVVTFNNGEDSTAVLDGFTIQNGLAAGGGGILCEESSPSLINVMITGNSAYNGGGMINYNSSPKLENCIFSGNSADVSGGGVFCESANSTLLNCILWNNIPEEIYLHESSYVTATYSDIQGGWEGEGNIDADPLFCNPDSGDFTLAENSPCVGTGENEADMGAFGVGCGPINMDANVNFSFDLSCYHGIFEELSGGYTPYIKGNWNNWDNSIPMSDEDGDHIWTASVDLSDGEYIFYVYATGPLHYFTLLAPVGSECDYYHDDPYGNWGFEINDSTGNELNLPTYSPNSCSECSTNEYFYLTHDGHERFNIVHLPDGYEDLNEDVPLILNLHAYSKYALYQQLMTGMDYWADMQNVITVYPQAIPGPGGVRAWNCGINGNPDFPTPDVDDVGFISALIDTLVENYAIDPDRIYSCGISNGGFMSYKLACELNDKITAIGSVTGTFAESDADECSIERFMPVMDFHGTYDTVVPYEGAEGWMSVDETVAFWTGHNETDTYETYEYPDIVTGDNSTVNRFTYTNSSNNVQVVQYQIVGGGHEWPGAGYNYGWNNYDINAGAELVDFFLQYRLSDLLYVNKNDLPPTRFSLHQNYPNPFNPVTTLRYDLPEDAMVNITIFDMMGRVIKTIVNSQQNAGFKSVRWNATNDYGKPVSAGIYLYMIQAGEYRQTRKMVLLK